jgi:hypothetical protein
MTKKSKTSWEVDRKDGAGWQPIETAEAERMLDLTVERADKRMQKRAKGWTKRTRRALLERAKRDGLVAVYTGPRTRETVRLRRKG